MSIVMSFQPISSTFQKTTSAQRASSQRVGQNLTKTPTEEILKNLRRLVAEAEASLQEWCFQPSASSREALDDAIYKVTQELSNYRENVAKTLGEGDPTLLGRMKALYRKAFPPVLKMEYLKKKPLNILV